MGSPSGQSSGCLVNFVNWNVKSLNDPVKREKVITHLQYLKSEIAFLQETHLCGCDQFKTRGGWIGQSYQ